MDKSEARKLRVFLMPILHGDLNLSPKGVGLAGRHFYFRGE